MKNRRAFLKLATGCMGAGSLAVWSGCHQKGGAPAAPLLTPEQQLALLKQVSVVGIKIGENLQALEHPALRIAGLVMESGGRMAVTYISYRDGSQQLEHFSLEPAEIERIQTEGYVKLIRIDGVEELYCVCPSGLAGKAIKLFTNE